MYNILNLLALEIVRNMSGYFLVTIGLFAIGLGGKMSDPIMSDAGKGLVGAALLAFQVKRAPEGNTTTTQVTTTPPDVPPTPVVEPAPSK